MKGFVTNAEMKKSFGSWGKILKKHNNKRDFRLWIDVCGGYGPRTVEPHKPPVGNCLRLAMVGYTQKQSIAMFLDQVVDAIGRERYPFELKPETKDDKMRDNLGRAWQARLKEQSS